MACKLFFYNPKYHLEQAKRKLVNKNKEIVKDCKAIFPLFAPEHKEDSSVKAHKKNQKKMQLPEFDTILDFHKHFSSEEKCIKYLEQTRWNGRPYCPDCLNDDKVYFLKNQKRHKCGHCKRQFNVKTGTVFEGTKLSMQKWFYAIYMLLYHKRGLSALQLSRDLKINEKSAWFMLHRLRHAIQTNQKQEEYEGVTEVDEAYIGGKARNMHYDKRIALQEKYGTNEKGYYNYPKEMVVGLYNRDTKQIRMWHEPDRDVKKLRRRMVEQISSSGILMSDGHQYYCGADKAFRDHRVVDHARYEYVNGDTYTNSIEGVWSHLKRTLITTYCHVSPKHLNRYLSEFEFRFNSQKYSIQHVFDKFLFSVDGRLRYCDLIGSRRKPNNRAIF